MEQEIYFDFIPENLYISPGIWSFLIGTQEKESSFYFYLPSQAARNQNTRFFEPNPNLTLTIPSTASKVITVGAYDSTYDAYADFPAGVTGMRSGISVFWQQGRQNRILRRRA